MARLPNPYRPGFNQAPLLLAGRDDVLDGAVDALEQAALDARTPRPLVVVGSRGVGKTVLLTRLADLAAERFGWLTVHVEVRPHQRFTDLLAARLLEAAAVLTDAPPGPRFEVDTATVRARLAGVGAELTVRRRAPEPVRQASLGEALHRAVDAALARESGLVLTVDEVQLASHRELAGFAATLQERTPDDWPLVVALAGLPSVRSPRRSVTYLERAAWYEIGLLDEHDTARALAGPAAQAGRPISPAALDLLTATSGGYPYAVQVLGHYAWRESFGAPEITLGHARAALPRAHADLAAGLYQARWDDASPRQQEYLAAVAELLGRTGEATGGDVARLLGAEPAAVSYLRDRLLQKGTLYADGRALRFPTPGMARWITDHATPDA